MIVLPASTPPPPPPYEPPEVREISDSGMFTDVVDGVIDRTEFEKGGIPDWAAGYAVPNEHRIILNSEDPHTILHEIGHLAGRTPQDPKTNTRNISALPDFSRAIEETVMAPQSGPLDSVGRSKAQYRDAHDIISGFPGILGNPKMDIGDGYMWGGPEELFAALFAYSEGDITRIPPKLRVFYEPFLGTQLTRGQQADAARLLLQSMPPVRSMRK